MRTISIISADWSGPDPKWVRQPWLDGGRLRFDRMHRPDWDHLFDALGRRARVDALAFGLRGRFDTGAVNSLPIARAAYLAGPRVPLMPFYDTVGLPDVTHNLYGSPFDFDNPAHIDAAWTYYGSLFFEYFGDCALEGTADRRVLMLWWGIASDNGHGFVNQRWSQTLLDYFDAQVRARGFHGADHIVDQTWLTFAPNLDVYGVHDWFNPWATPPRSYSIRSHRHITTAVVVPSFYNPRVPGAEIIPANGAQTLEKGLRACRVADYIFLESGPNFMEGAELLPDASGDDAKLRAIATHVAVPDEPIPGGLMHLAVSRDPILKWQTGILVSSPLGSNRYAMRWTQPANQPGYPDAKSSKFLCLNPDGTTEAKDVIGEWESSQPVKPGDVEIRWFTVDAGGEHSSALVYGLQQFDAA